MSLSPIWRALPGDITEQILSLLVAAHFHTDPAYTWTSLRHLSAHQKRVIEHRFARFWLPRLGITLYAGVRHRVEYALDQTPTPTLTPTLDGGILPVDSGGDTAVFAVQRQVHNPLLGVSQDSRPGKLAGRYLRRAWGLYDPAAHRNVTVRLGEGVLGGGCRGGYILNDTDLPGLEVLDDNKIRFCWKGAVDELLREEMYMRRVGEEMFMDACEEWCTRNPQGLAAALLPPPRIQLKIWRCRVQAARRVATFKHRVAKSNATARPIQLEFGATSQRLHKQEPDPDALEAVKKWECCSSCSRWQTPDIFEVLEAEESVVPRLGVFQTWLRQQQFRDDEKQDHDSHRVGLNTIVGLYRDEFAWRAWLQNMSGQAHEDELDDEKLYRYQQRDRRWDTGLDAILLRTEKVRWEQAP